MAIPLRRLAFLLAVSMSTSGRAQTPVHHGAQVVLGAGSRWVELVPHPEQWEFVRANADGFYVNFIGMDHAMQVKVNDLAKLMTHKVAFLESDMHDATAAADQRSLLMLQIAGFSVPYTSLNYGWSRERSDNLKSFALPAGQPRRLCVVQEGPWTLGGDLHNDTVGNAEKRSYIDQDDGDSTDGVMGFWQADTKGMRAASYSMVRYAHAQGKRSLVMVTPYAAKVPTYDPEKDFLSTAQDCVRRHEDAGAAPDYWSVFEYATSFPLLPETGADGLPANTLTGTAYWLLHHLHDPQHWARMESVHPVGESTPISFVSGNPVDPILPLCLPGSSAVTRTFLVRLRNDSSWLDLCPVIRARFGPGLPPRFRCSLDGQDVTRMMLNDNGLACVAGRRMWPQSVRNLQITLSAGTRPVDLQLELFTHPSSMTGEAQQLLRFHLPAVSSADLAPLPAT